MAPGSVNSVNNVASPNDGDPGAGLSPVGDPLLASVLNALPLHVAVIDPLGIIRQVNQRWRDFAHANGGDDRLCDGADYLDACRRAARDGATSAMEVTTAIEHVLTGQQRVFELEYPCEGRDQTWWYLQRIVPITVSGERWALVTHEDITARRSAHEILEVERTKLQTLLDTANDGIHVTDASGAIVFFSSSFARMLGYSNEEMSTLRRATWSRDPEAARFEESLAQDAGATHDIATQYRRKDGGLIHVEVRERLIRLAGIPYLYGSARDVTERHVEEENKQRHLVELERINRELDDFVYVASHDLRSPLRAVITLAQWIIDDDVNLHEKTNARLVQIQSRARRMSQLLDDIQRYARAGRDAGLSGVKLSATALVGEVVATMQIPTGFTICASATLNSVPVQRMPLEQVLHNLLGNAIKHHDRSSGEIRIEVVDAGKCHRFFVEDDGPGIPDAYRETVFEMFSTLKPRDEVEGSGMGLALVRKIVMGLGGSCGIETGRARGTRLWFDWPKIQQS